MGTPEEGLMRNSMLSFVLPTVLQKYHSDSVRSGGGKVSGYGLATAGSEAVIVPTSYTPRSSPLPRRECGPQPLGSPDVQVQAVPRVNPTSSEVTLTDGMP